MPAAALHVSRETRINSSRTAGFGRRIFSPAGLFVALLLLAGAVWLVQWLASAVLVVTSEPGGAVVLVDGDERGVTPLAGVEITPGVHKLVVRHSHFAPHAERLSVTRGENIVRHVRLVPGEGTLQLQSNPRGAWVEVDGVRLGSPTPTSLRTSSGEHVIRMGLPERHAAEETHVLDADSTLTVTMNLDIDPHGTVTFSLRPRDARVEFVGEALSYAPRMRVPLGEYAVRVSRPGYVPQSFRYAVQYGDNVQTVALERAYGRLEVHAEPAGADVQVSFEEGGRTQRRQMMGGALRLPVGPVTVRVRALNHRTAVRRVKLEPDGAAVQVALVPVSVAPGTVIEDVLQDGGRGPVMVVMPAGSFAMGNAAGPPSEQPVREVTITQPFAMGRHEVTVGEYLRFARAQAVAVNERLDRDAIREPMIYVSFQQATAYAGWLSEQTGESYRLPTEAEWEYAARSGSSGAYFFGDDPLELCSYANLADESTRKLFRDWQTLACDDGAARRAPVGSYAPNAFGLHDVYGNVSEWVADCGMPGYADAPLDGSAAEEGRGCASHGIRGGSWDSTAEELRSAYRNTATDGNDDRGFRLVRDL